MGMIICDENGQEPQQWMNLGQPFNEGQLIQPLVTERRERFSFPFGDAELVQIVLPNIHIIYGDLIFWQQQLHMRRVDLPELVELHFSLAGNSVVQNKANGRTYVFTPRQQNITYVPEFDGIAHFDHQKQEGYKFFEVHFVGHHFVELVKDSCDVLLRFADHVANGRSAELSPQSLPINMAMQNCINDIMNCHFQGGLKLLFLQAKCIELLTLQAQAFEHAQQAASRPVLRSAYEKERILQARDYLLLHMDTPPSLPELSKIAGLNTYKLKNGFKEVFNNTVYGYLNDVKLMHAREQLLQGVSIKEISIQLGYGSVQHFSKAFRKKFGIPPGQSRK